MELATAHPTTKADSEKHDVVHFEVKKSAAPGDVEHERRLRLSDRDLQVLDLKAAGALSCSSIIEAMQTGSHSIAYSPHHACTMHPLADVAEPLLADGKQT